MDSAGVATEAQETFMTSLSAKTEQFNASVQELYYDFLSSDLAGGVIDFGTEIIQVFDNIIDSVGSVTAAIGAAGLVGAISSLFKALSTMGTAGSFTNALGATSLGKLFGDIGAGFSLAKDSISSATSVAGAASGVFGSLWAVIQAHPFATLLSAVAAVAGIFTLLSNNAEQSKEEMIEAGEEAQNAINETYKDYQSKASKVNTERYGELVTGVNPETNENVSLASDEYQEYLALCNDIAEVYPELVTGYTEQGDAILNLGNNAETATAQLEAMLQVDEMAANFEIADNLEAAFLGAYTQAQNLQEEIDDLTKSVSEYDDELLALGTAANDVSSENMIAFQLQKIADGERDVLKLNGDWEDYYEITDALQYALESVADLTYGVDYVGESIYDDEGNVTQAFTFYGDAAEKLAENMDEIGGALNISFMEQANEAGEARLEDLNRIATLEKEYAQTWDDLVPSIISSMATNPNYYELTDDIQDGIGDAISNISFSDLPSDVLEGDKSLEEYVKEEFLYPIADAFNDVTNSDVAKAAQDAYMNLFSLDANELTNREYATQMKENLAVIQDYFQKFYGEDWEQEYQEFTLRFGFNIVVDVDEETGEETIDNAADAARKSVEQAYSKEFGGGISQDVINSITEDQMESMAEMIAGGEIFSNAYKQVVEDAQSTIDSSSLTFSGLLFDSEGEQSEFSQSIDDFQSYINDINSALDSVRDEESEVNLVDLKQQFEGLSGGVEDLETNLSGLALDSLKGFSETWKENTEGLEGDQLAESIEAFMSAIAAVDLTSLDLSHWQTDIMNNLLSGLGEDAWKYEQNVSGLINKAIEEYGDEMSEEEMMDVITKIMLIPEIEGASWEEFSDYFDQMRDEEVEIEINMHTEEIEKAENELDKLKTVADNLQNEMDRNDLFGTTNGNQMYRDLINNGNLQIKNLEQQKALWQEIAAAADPLDSEYAEAYAEIADIESEINSVLSSQQEWNAAAEALNYEAGEALSAYNEASSSRNAGDNYKDMKSAFDAAQELYEEGLVGTDEFQTAAAMLSPNGMTDAANWVENYGNAVRYFTDDVSGCVNALNDLRDVGLATYDEQTGYWWYDAGKIEEQASALGISLESYMSIMGRLQDYGFTNDWFATTEDGVAHMGDLYADLAQAEIKLQDLQEKRAAGDKNVTDTVINEQLGEIETIQRSLTDSQSLLTQLESMETTTFEAEMQANYQALNTMLAQAGNIEDERIRQAYYGEMEQWAKENQLDVGSLFTYDSSTGQVTGIINRVWQDLLDSYGMIDMTPVTTSMAQTVGAALTDGLADSESGIQEAIDSIVESYTPEELEAITFDDQQYTAGLEAAEAEMDNLLTALNLGQESGETLAQILSSYIETGDIDAAIAQVEELQQATENTTSAAQQLGESLAESFQDAGESGQSTQDAFDKFVQDYQDEAGNLPDFSQIIWGNGEYEAGFEDVEAAIDAMATSLGIAEEDAGALAELLTAYAQEGSLEAAIQFLADTSEPESAIEALSDEEIEIRMAVDEELEGDEWNSSIEGLMAHAEHEPEVVAAKLGIETDQLDIVYDYLNELQAQADIEANVTTYFDDGGTYDEIAKMENEEITATFGIEGEEEIETFRAEMETLESQEYDMTVKLEDSQFQALLESQEGQNEIPVTVDTEEAMGEVQTLQGAIDELINSSTNSITINVDISAASSALNDLQAQISEVMAGNGLTVESGAGFASTEELVSTYSVPITGEVQSITVSAEIDSVPITGELSTIDVSAEVQTIPVSGQMSDISVSADAPPVPVTGTLQNISVEAEAPSVPVSGKVSSLEVTATVSSIPIDGNITSITNSVEAPSVNMQGSIVTISIDAEVPDASGIANYSVGDYPPTVPDAQGVANYILGSYPTSVPSVTGTANYVLGSYPTSLPTITQTVVQNVVTNGGSSSSSGEAFTGTAYSEGSLKKGWESFKKVGGSYVLGASYASGTGSWHNWSIPQNEEALVNEFGDNHPESIVRNGKWMIIPGGAHVEALKKGDIVFSAAQTEELIKYGRVMSGGGFGRIAHADGTAYNVINAYNGGTFVETATTTSSSSSTTTTSTGSSSSSSSGGSSSGSSGGSSSSSTTTTTSTTSTETTADTSAFEDWVGTLFDWIEVRLERLTDKIQNYIQKAENALNTRNYNGAASGYRSALSGTITQITQEDKAYTKYMNEVDKVLRKATEAELISANGCEILKKQMKNGQLVIEEYSEAMQPVVSAVQEFYEKALDASSAIQQLNADIISYTQSLKSLRDTQRDAKIDTYESYLSAANSTYTSTSGNYYKHYQSQQNLANTALKNENKAYTKETKKLDNDASKARKKSAKAVKKAYKSSSGKYKKALKNAYKAVSKKQAVSSSDMKIIGQNSDTVYAYLEVYNETLNNSETARLEEALNYATTSAESLSNTSDSYARYNDAVQNNIDLYESRASNSNVAKTANKYLDQAASQYSLISQNNQDEIDAYAAQVKSNQKTINKNKGTTNKLAKQSKKEQKAVQKVVNKCKKHAQNGTAIGATELALLDQYFSQGYITRAFYESCYDYNNALEHQREAEAQKLINDETEKAEKRAYGQEEFENVQNEYQNKTNQNQAQTARIQAEQNYQTTRGLYMTAQNYDDLIAQSQKDYQIYSEEIDALNEQIKHNLDSGYWDETDQEYIDAKLAVDELSTSMINCLTDIEDFGNSKINLPFEEVERMIEELTTLQALYESVANLMTAQGQDLSLTEYTDQLDTLFKQVEQWQKDLAEAENNLALAEADAEGVYGGKDVQVWTNEVNEYQTEINNCEIAIENMKDSLRDDIIWRQFDRAHSRAQELLDVLEGISGLLDESMWFTYEGQITEFGVAEISSLTKQISAAQTDVQNYMNDIDTLQKLYDMNLEGIDITDDLTKLAELNDEYYDLLEYGFYSDEEYTEKMAELQEQLLDAANSVQDLTNDIINMYKTAAQYELDAIFEVIDAESKALDAKKSYYDYDKQISSKTKNVQALEAELAALQGVDTAEAAAQRKRLEEELSQESEELDDLVLEHTVELSQNALEELQNSLQESFDQYFQDVFSDLDEITYLMGLANQLTADNTEQVTGTLEKLLDFYGIDSKASGVLTSAGYASGTKSAATSSIAKVEELGPELVIRSSTGEILRPISKGDAVIPADLTENLFKWGAIDPAALFSSNAVTVPVVDVQSGATINQNFDSLLNVEGNVDSTVVSDLEAFVQQFYEGAYEYNVKHIAQDARKVGIKVGH